MHHTCPKHNVRWNSDTVRACPLCAVQPIINASYTPEYGVRTYSAKYQATGITEPHGSKEYFREYKKLNRWKKYKREWTRRRREEWRKTIGRIKY